MPPYLRLKFERQRRGLTQMEIANRTRLPQVTISAIENGRVHPNDAELAALSQAFGVSPARLLEPVRVQEDEAPEITEPSRVLIGNKRENKSMMHSSACSGCPRCDLEMLEALRAFNAGADSYCRWLSARTEKLRTAGTRGALRTGIHVQEYTMKNDYTPPDIYGPALAARAASERRTPEQALRAFEEQYKAARTRELAAEHARLDAHVAARPRPRFTAAELAAFAPP